MAEIRPTATVLVEAPLVKITIDGNEVVAPAGTTIFDAARTFGVKIPTLCHAQNEAPVGVCRLCVVDAGQRVYTASCVRVIEPGMKISTADDGVKAVRRTVLELLMADHPSPCARQRATGDCELETQAAQHGLTTSRFAPRPTPRGKDESLPAIAVDLEACILCDRCIRGCGEIRHNFVLSRRGKGYQAGIAFDDNLPMGESSCVSCGECMVSCPTGALTNRKTIATDLGSGEGLTLQELRTFGVFADVSGTFLNLNSNAIKKRHFKAGEIICREGEYGSTAFYIVKGKADVYLTGPMGHVTTKEKNGLFKKSKASLKNRAQQPRSDESKREFIPIDAPIDLPYENPVGVLEEGDLFGEMTCMNAYPRSATVRASTDCVMLEMLRNVLDVLQRNKTFRAKVDAAYRKRALATQLRSIPMFSKVSDDFIAHLRDKVQLRRYTPGQLICREGDPSHSFFLVRIGFVKVTQSHPGGDMVLGYIGRGGFFGEMSLLGEGVRTASCIALDHVDAIQIRDVEFRELTERFPDVRNALQEVSRQRTNENSTRLTRVENVPVDLFLEQGLMEAQNLLIIDLERCTRCDQCVRACGEAHDGVSRLIRDGLRWDKYLVATSCRHCKDPLCMVGCPVGSIRRRATLDIVIEDWCIGCGLCANNCPYGNINMHPFETLVADPAHAGKKIPEVHTKATACNLCMDQGEPSCVYACPHDAAHRVNPREFFSQLVHVSAEPPRNV